MSKIWLDVPWDIVFDRERASSRNVYITWATPCSEIQEVLYGWQSPPILQPGSVWQESIRRDALKERWQEGLRYTFPPPNLIQMTPGQASKMGRGPNHDHTLLARSELVTRDHAPSNRATKKVQTISVAPMESNNQGSNSKCHEKHPVDCLEAHITICAQSGIREEIARKVTDSWTKGTKQNYQGMFEWWCSFSNERWLPVLKVCVSNLMEYLDYLQVTHDYAYTTLCMHASAFYNILQPT